MRMSNPSFRLQFRLLLFALPLFFSPTAYAQTPSPVPVKGLIGYWPGDGNPKDFSPLKNNGRFEGPYAAAPTGEAFNLGSDAVSIPNNAAYDAFRSYEGYTIGFWFNPNGIIYSGSNPAVFMGQDNGSGFKPKWFIDYGYTFFGGNSDYVFHVNDYRGERIFIKSNPQESPTGWNQLTVTVNNRSDGLVTFYLNGQYIGSGNLGDYVLDTTAPLKFGEAEGYTYQGLMNNVVIYNRVLTTNEIQQLVTHSPPPVIKVNEISQTRANILTPGVTYVSVSPTTSPAPPQLDQPSLSMKPANNGVVLLWAVSTPAFRLEQNGDLNTTNWMANTDPVAVINGTNQVTVSPAPGSMFYRLISP